MDQASVRGQDGTDRQHQLPLGDDLKQALPPGVKLKVAASCFSMYAYEALKAELEKIEELHFIFTAPAFVANEVTDKIRREHSLYGSEFKIQLRNKLTQRAIAKECANWPTFPSGQR